MRECFYSPLYLHTASGKRKHILHLKSTELTGKSKSRQFVSAGMFLLTTVSSYSVGEKKTPHASKIGSANGQEKKAGGM